MMPLVSRVNVGTVAMAALGLAACTASPPSSSASPSPSASPSVVDEGAPHITSPHHQFVFDAVAVTTGGSFREYPAMNADGSVAYVYGPALGDVQVLLTDTHGSTTTIADFTGQAFSIATVGGPTVNDAGAVAFDGLLPDLETAVLDIGDTDGVTTIADTHDVFEAFSGVATINDDGDVAFGAIRRDGSEGLYLHHGDDTNLVVETGFEYATFRGGPALGRDGTIAFNADRGHALGLGIFKKVNGEIYRVADREHGFEVVEGTPALNQMGQVAFLALAPVTGIYVGDEVNEPTLLVAAGVSGTPAMNDDGLVAYTEVTADGVRLQIQPIGGDPSTVIRAGDPLLGSTVTSIGLSPFGFQSRNRVAFGVELEDGRSAIIRARLASHDHS